jgi:DNA-binding XRE family transcriptional regulator
MTLTHRELQLRGVSDVALELRMSRRRCQLRTSTVAQMTGYSAAHIINIERGEHGASHELVTILRELYVRWEHVEKAKYKLQTELAKLKARLFNETETP